MTQRTKKFVFFFSFLLIALISRSQSPEFTGWFTSFNTIHVHGKFGLQTDAQIKSADQWKALQLIFLRGGLTLRPSKSTFLGLGYIHANERETIDSISGYALESRIYEEFIFSHILRPFNVLHRFRLEERFIPTPDLVDGKIGSGEHVYSTRLCYLFRGVVPLIRIKEFTRGFYLALQDEVYVNLSHWDHVNGKFFDLNRIAAGAGYRFSEAVDAEAGYIGQVELDAEGNYGFTNVLQCTLIMRLNKRSDTKYNPVPGGQ